MSRLWTSPSHNVSLRKKLDNFAIISWTSPLNVFFQHTSVQWHFFVPSQPGRKTIAMIGATQFQSIVWFSKGVALPRHFVHICKKKDCTRPSVQGDGTTKTNICTSCCRCRWGVLSSSRIVASFLSTLERGPARQGGVLHPSHTDYFFLALENVCLCVFL